MNCCHLHVYTYWPYLNLKSYMPQWHTVTIWSFFLQISELGSLQADARLARILYGESVKLVHFYVSSSFIFVVFTEMSTELSVGIISFIIWVTVWYKFLRNI